MVATATAELPIHAAAAKLDGPSWMRSRPSNSTGRRTGPWPRGDSGRAAGSAPAATGEGGGKRRMGSCRVLFGRRTSLSPYRRRCSSDL